MLELFSCHLEQMETEKAEYKREVENLQRMLDVLLPVVHLTVQSATLNSSPSKFRFFVQINRGAELRVHFNIGSQWSVSIEIV